MVLSCKQVLDGSSGGLLDLSQQMGGRLQARNQQHDEINGEKKTLKCPRCESSNTKFCYYNNYSRLQPRHFCRACKRHWTQGGTLRNVPLGGAPRNNNNNKRLKTSHNATDSATPNNNVVTPFTSGAPEILRQVWLQPPPPRSDFGGIGSNWLTPFQFLPEFGGTEPGVLGSNDDRPTPNPCSFPTSSASDPSSLSSLYGDDGAVNAAAMDGPSTSAWLSDASYWSYWDGISDRPQ